MSVQMFCVCASSASTAYVRWEPTVSRLQLSSTTYEFLLLPPLPSCDTLNLCLLCFTLLFSLRRCLRTLVGNSNSGACLYKYAQRAPMEPNRSPMTAVTRIMLCPRNPWGDVSFGIGGTAWNGSPTGFKCIDHLAQLFRPILPNIVLAPLLEWIQSANTYRMLLFVLDQPK